MLERLYEIAEALKITGGYNLSSKLFYICETIEKELEKIEVNFQKYETIVDDFKYPIASKKKPTEIGYYWIKNYKTDHPLKIVEVVFANRLIIAGGYSLDNNMYKDYLWIGPISVPQFKMEKT